MSHTLAAYERGAAQYQEFWRDRRPRDALRRFAELTGRGGRVLDPASGPALDVRLLRDAGLHPVAGDLAFEPLRLSKVLHPKGSLARWDLRRLPFADATFDGIWGPTALQHLPRAHIRPSLAELRRVQRRGPIFLSFREGFGDLEPVDDPPVGTVYATTVTAAELQALILDAGYRQVEVETRADPLERSHVTWLYGWGLLPA